MRVVPLSVLIVSLPLLAGCGTIFGGTTETISVQSSPAGVTVTTNPATGTFTTPASIELDRKDSYTITAKKDGYSDGQAFIRKKIRSGVLIADILLGGWFLVDYLTGGLWDLTPDQVLVSLERQGPEVDGPEIIELRFEVAEGEGLTVSSPSGPVDGLTFEVTPVP